MTENNDDMADMFVGMLIEKVASLSKENETLKQEVQILTEALRDLQWKMDGLNK